MFEVLPVVSVLCTSVKLTAVFHVCPFFNVIITGAVLDRIFIFVVSSPSIYGRC